MIPHLLIERKREGESLGRDDVKTFFRGYLQEEVTEYQMAAFLMAVHFQGLSADELDALVEVMIRSGRVLDLSSVPPPRIDKHSTGGVGDKVSLVLAPLAAALEIRVPMMSGRGLGHTGGTLDKLEAIAGFRTDLDLEAFRKVLASVGCAMIGQTEEIAPLDRRLYDLRSVTATVPSIPLIAASIMSKKLAEDLTGLVLDVKVGAGAFLPEEERALELARTMVRIGAGRGVATTALLTAMDRPLGHAVGNALETREAVACLGGGGPADLREVVTALAVEMLRLAGGSVDPAEAWRRVESALDGGGAAERFAALVEAQGGDPGVVDDPDRLPASPERKTVTTGEAGTVLHVQPRTLGNGVVELGGGRTRLGEEIDPAVGFVLEVTPGDRVEVGDPLGTVHAADEAGLRRGGELLLEAVELGEGEPRLRPLRSHRVTVDGVEALE